MGHLRTLTLATLLLLPLVPVQAAPGFQPMVDEKGTFLATTVGTAGPAWPQGVPAVDHATFPVPVSPCHTTLEVALSWEPNGVTVGDGDPVQVSTPYTFRLTLLDPDGQEIHNVEVDRQTGFRPFGTVPAPDTYEVRVEVLIGAAVDWHLRVRGKDLQDDPSCHVWINEVELNPDGPDTGEEWVEVYNEGDTTMDLSGWMIRGVNWTRHVDEIPFTIPDGTQVAPGDHLKVPLTGGEYLDDVDEIVQLVHPDGGVLDQTPSAHGDRLTDKKDDGQTHQRDPDGSSTWVFASGTPGGSNGT